MIAGQKLRFSQSIAIQVLIPMVVIGLLALASMLVSLLVTLNTQHDAEAINIAGSMRMQSYRIAVLLQQPKTNETSQIKLAETLKKEHEEFSQKLYQSSISTAARQKIGSAIQERYKEVVNSWENNISPILSINLPAETVGSKQPRSHQLSSQQPSFFQISSKQLNLISEQYLSQVENHVNKIDALVLSIQKNTEEKIELLGIYEGLSIFLSFLALVFIVMRADQNLVKPLKDLVRAAERTSVGDFSYRAYYEGVNEIGLLCSTFNNMSANLARHYRKLEDLVNEKTAQLQQTNHMLDFLYSTAQRLSDAPIEHKKLKSIVTDLKKLTAIPQLSLCLTSEINPDKYDLISPIDDQHPCNVNDCVKCFTLPEKKDLEKGEESFPIEDADRCFGFLYIKTGENLPLEPWQKRLIEAVVEHLSFAMALQYREGLNRRLMLIEERSIIARELHDSLAQSLSYMKMQVARISRLSEKKAPEEDIRESLDDLHQGINAAYKHLRELLTTFRLKLDTPSLYLALKATVDEFDKMRDDIDIVLDYELGPCPLSANEDIHVLQIIREAITNAIKHSQADRIELKCAHKNDHQTIFSVIDNGIGISESPHKEHHYGLSTMQERAELVDGQLNITSNNNNSDNNQGTTVSLEFTPKAVN